MNTFRWFRLLVVLLLAALYPAAPVALQAQENAPVEAPPTLYLLAIGAGENGATPRDATGVVAVADSIAAIGASTFRISRLTLLGSEATRDRVEERVRQIIGTSRAEDVVVILHGGAAPTGSAGQTAAVSFSLEAQGVGTSGAPQVITPTLLRTWLDVMPARNRLVVAGGASGAAFVEGLASLDREERSGDVVAPSGNLVLFAIGSAVSPGTPRSQSLADALLGAIGAALANDGVAMAGEIGNGSRVGGQASIGPGGAPPATESPPAGAPEPAAGIGSNDPTRPGASNSGFAFYAGGEDFPLGTDGSEAARGAALAALGRAPLDSAVASGAPPTITTGDRSDSAGAFRVVALFALGAVLLLAVTYRRKIGALLLRVRERLGLAYADEVGGRDRQVPARRPSGLLKHSTTLVIGAPVLTILLLAAAALLVRNRTSSLADASGAQIELDNVTAMVQVHGRVVGARPAAVRLNDRPAEVEPDFSFRGVVPILETRRPITVHWTDDGGATFERRIDLPDDPGRGVVVGSGSDPAPTGPARQGRDVALLFATNDYQYWNDLRNPLDDAQAIATELSRSYGFEVHLIRNPTRDEIRDTLNHYATLEFLEEDQLLVFFAGHGSYLQENLLDGFVVGSDTEAVQQDPMMDSAVLYNWLRRRLTSATAAHVLLILDVCYGGSFDDRISEATYRSEDDDPLYRTVDANTYVRRKMALQTRRYLTAGGMERVPDGRPGEHSPFTRRLLESLRSYGGDDGVLTLAEIATTLQMVDPEPRAGGFDGDEPGSDFVFIARRE